MPAVDIDHVFSIDSSQWRQKWKKIQAPKLSEAKEVAYFSRIDGKCVPDSRAALHPFIKPHDATNLKGDDLPLFRSKNKALRGWSYLEPHKKCGVDVLDSDFVSQRGVLMSLAFAFDDLQDSSEIHAVRLKPGEPIFLAHRWRGYNPATNPNSHHSKTPPGSPRSKNCRAAVDAHAPQKKTSPEELGRYFGARFEAICTGQTIDTGQTQFFSMLERSIGNYKVLLTAETDCRLPGNQESHSQYVELKCRLKGKKKKNYWVKQHKYKKYWLQCYLASVPTIYEGVRTKSGALLDINRLQTSDLAKKSKKSRWDKHEILARLEYILDKISEVCTAHMGTTVRIQVDAEDKKLLAELIRGDNFGILINKALSKIQKGRKENHDTIQPRPVSRVDKPDLLHIGRRISRLERAARSESGGRLILGLLTDNEPETLENRPSTTQQNSVYFREHSQIYHNLVIPDRARPVPESQSRQSTRGQSLYETYVSWFVSLKNWTVRQFRRTFFNSDDMPPPTLVSRDENENDFSIIRNRQNSISYLEHSLPRHVAGWRGRNGGRGFWNTCRTWFVNVKHWIYSRFSHSDPIMRRQTPYVPEFWHLRSGASIWDVYLVWIANLYICFLRILNRGRI